MGYTSTNKSWNVAMLPKFRCHYKPKDKQRNKHDNVFCLKDWYSMCICVDLWQEILDNCFHHTEPDIQMAAVNAIPAFFLEYYRESSGAADPRRQGTSSPPLP